MMLAAEIYEIDLPEQPEESRTMGKLLAFRTEKNSVVEPMGLITKAKTALDLITQAEEEAKEIIQEAESRASEIELSAERIGLNRGLQQAAREIAAANKLKNGALKRSRELIHQIALSVAEEVIGESLAEHPESINKRLERAISSLPEIPLCQIVVSQAEAEIARDWLAKKEASNELSVSLQVRVDSELDKGELRLEHQAGEILVSPRAHLQSLSSHLESWLEASLTSEDLNPAEQSNDF